MASGRMRALLGTCSSRVLRADCREMIDRRSVKRTLSDEYEVNPDV